jgi:hypothetical protein
MITEKLERQQREREAMRQAIAPKVIVIGQYQFGKYQRPL